MRRILLILILPIQVIFAQEQISLEECYSLARENYPKLKQTEIWSEISALEKENIKTNNLPQLALNAQATYQSDVTGIEIPVPGIDIPTVSKDQYKAYAEFKQTIWDGGISEINQKLEDALLKNNLSQLEVEMYKLNEQVSQAFFTVLLVNKQADVLQAQNTVLEEKLKSIESAIRNGIAEKSAAFVLQAEILKLQQNQIQLYAAKNAACKMLSILTGTDISNETDFNYNANNSPVTNTKNRPELELFSNQSKQLNTQMELLDKTRNPKLFGFGQAGFGKPGLNMLNDEFDAYYLVGVGISWNAFDWKTTLRKKQVLKLQQEMIQTQEETFSQNIQLLLTRQNEEIKKLENIIESDEEMIKLRSEITKAASSKLENETITTSDYVRELQAETISKLNLELHKIQLDEANEKYKLIAGK